MAARAPGEAGTEVVLSLGGGVLAAQARQARRRRAKRRAGRP